MEKPDKDNDGKWQILLKFMIMTYYYTTTTINQLPVIKCFVNTRCVSNLGNYSPNLNCLVVTSNHVLKTSRNLFGKVLETYVLYFNETLTTNINNLFTH